MKVSITQLRQDLFRLADRALAGEDLEFTYKGSLFRIVPEGKASKLAKLSRTTLVAPQSDSPNRDLLNEMEAEWEQDWSEL